MYTIDSFIVILWSLPGLLFIIVPLILFVLHQLVKCFSAVLAFWNVPAVLVRKSAANQS